jgi:protein-S-isoprenylcysteine O-methyltransferase Ste14
MYKPTAIALLPFFGVVLCWIVFTGIFLLRKRPPKAQEAKRDRLSLLGIFLQMCAYFLVWFQPPHKPFLPPVAGLSGGLEIALASFTIAIAAGSVWLAASALRTLGKQWAIAARLVEGHKLITEGPYRHLRNPIYTAMLGLLVATGLAMRHWTALIPALVLFTIGLVIRVRSEEKLLRAAFGKEFEEYAKRVPAVLPGIY